MGLPLEALALCDNHAPASGQSVICTAAVPNPDPTGVNAVAGSSNVTVTVQSAAVLAATTGAGITVRNQSVVTNGGGVALGATNAFDGLFAQGNGNSLTNNGTIVTAGSSSDGIQLEGTGNTAVQTATGSIVVTGAGANGMFAIYGSNNTFINAGSVSTSGRDGSAVRFFASTGGRVDNTGILSASGSGGMGVLASGTSVITVNNGASGTITSQAAHGISMLGGGMVVNDGAITATVGTGVLMGGTGASSVSNRGRISGTTGGVVFAGGNDRLEMLGGSISGGVVQASGNDALILSGGQIDAIDQGDGADTMQVDGGSVSGTVQQGAGIDTFSMSAGEIAGLTQGDARDSFVMSGGHITGAFNDGDTALMTGGQIGRVDMTQDDNLFEMSGGTIDGDLLAGAGNDTLRLSEGYIGGNISLGDGIDSIAVSGGTVRGDVLQGVGSDSFTWEGGGIVYGAIDLGADDDTVVLRNLSTGNLGGVPSLRGGSGNDALTFNNVLSNGVARFLDFETVNATDATQLTFDGTMLLGDAVSGTGVLNVDATSTLYAGGGYGGGVMSITAGQQVRVNNAGRLDLSNGGSGPTDTFNVFGTYHGEGGGLFLETVLGDDASPSDKLVIHGGSAEGSTGISIIQVGGSGAQTLADGILLVQAVDGASTRPGAFALYGTVAAGAYEYLLFRGGVNAGTQENWYLRSALVTVPPVIDPPLPAPSPEPTAPPLPAPAPQPPTPLEPAPPPLPPAPGIDPSPTPIDQPEPPAPAPPPDPPPSQAADPPPPLPAVLGTVAPPPGAIAASGDVVPLYRIEAPTYAILGPLAHALTRASLATFHERQGEQALLRGEGALRTAWIRAIGQDTEQHWRGTLEPSFDGSIQGLQAGADLFARESENLARDHAGLFLGKARADGDVRGFALGWENLSVGKVKLDDTHLGVYWTHVAASGAYVDTVLMAHRFDGDATSARGLGIEADGHGVTASVEIGYPVRWSARAGWTLEPQAQLVWQRQSFDDQRDAFAAISFDSEDALAGRVGLRLSRGVESAGGLLQPYLKANLWRGFGGDDRIDLDDDRVDTAQAYSAFEFGAGIVARFNPHLSGFLVADYTVDLGGTREQRETFEGNLGLRFDW